MHLAGQRTHRADKEDFKVSLNKFRRKPTNLSQRKTFQARAVLFPRGELLRGVPLVAD